MRNIVFSLIVMLILISSAPASVEAAEQAKVQEESDEAVIILSTVTTDEMLQAKKVLKQNGVRIKSVFPPSVFIAHVPRQLVDSLKELDFIEEITFDQITVINNFDDYKFPQRMPSNIGIIINKSN